MELIMNAENELERYQKAQKRVKEIKGFYRHLLVFSIVMMGMIFINVKYTPGHFWSIWVILSSGIPLIIHAIKVFKLIPFFSSNWEEKKIKQFIEEEESNKNKFE
jgi:ABC-type transport system involved in cytochrome bd biosynthesis fused ATPase/permease subunit